MDATVRAGSLVIEYADARSGAFLRRSSAKDAVLRHSAARNSVVAEFSVPGGRSCTLLLPLSEGLKVFSSLVAEGRFSVRAQLGNETATFLVTKSDAAEAQLFVECIRERKRADPAASRAARAAVAAARARAEQAGRDNLLSGFVRAVQGAAVTGKGVAPVAGSEQGQSASGAGSRATPAPSASLSDEQAAVVELIQSGASVFFTGGAGTGKSVVLSALRATLPAATTAFTGSTGVAACNIGGVTLHSFAGVATAALERYTRGACDLKELVDGVRRRKDAVQRWRTVRTLVIDEISMVDAATFDALSAVGSAIRGVDKPFGGIQLVCTGDFFQLPPVTGAPPPPGAAPAAAPLRRESSASVASGTSTVASAAASASAAAPQPIVRGYCFVSAAWARLRLRCVELTRVFRQANADFAAMLNEVRWGRCPEHVTAALRTRWAAAATSPAAATGIVPTKLKTHRADVDRQNAEELARLGGPGATVSEFAARDTVSSLGSSGGGAQEQQALAAQAAAVLDAATPVPRVLRLKPGAQVMLVKTLDQTAGLVNGARGVVTSILPAGAGVAVRLMSGAEVEIRHETWTVAVGGRATATRRQLPLDLAWAISIHKSQGTSLDLVEVDLSRVFEYGQAYVALSRATALGGLVLTAPFDPACVRAHPQVVEFYTALREAAAKEAARKAVPTAAGAGALARAAGDRAAASLPPPPPATAAARAPPKPAAVLDAAACPPAAAAAPAARQAAPAAAPLPAPSQAPRTARLSGASLPVGYATSVPASRAVCSAASAALQPGPPPSAAPAAASAPPPPPPATPRSSVRATASAVTGAALQLQQQRQRAGDALPADPRAAAPLPVLALPAGTAPAPSSGPGAGARRRRADAWSPPPRHDVTGLPPAPREPVEIAGAAPAAPGGLLQTPPRQPRSVPPPAVPPAALTPPAVPLFSAASRGAVASAAGGLHSPPPPPAPLSPPQQQQQSAAASRRRRQRPEGTPLRSATATAAASAAAAASPGFDRRGVAPSDTRPLHLQQRSPAAAAAAPHSRFRLSAVRRATATSATRPPPLPPSPPRASAPRGGSAAAVDETRSPPAKSRPWGASERENAGGASSSSSGRRRGACDGGAAARLAFDACCCGGGDGAAPVPPAPHRTPLAPLGPLGGAGAAAGAAAMAEGPGSSAGWLHPHQSARA